MMKLFTFFRIAFALSIFAFVSINLNAQNLVTNPGLESWDDANTPSDWDKYENITQETGTIHGGTYSAKQQAGTSDLTQELTGIVGENSYTISFWYFDNDVDSKCRIWSYWLSGGSTLPDNATELRPGTYSSDDANWQEYIVTIDAPATADGFRFEVRTYNDNSGSGFVYYDDFSVVDNGGSGGSNAFILYNEGFEADLGATSAYTVTGAQVWEWANYGVPPGCSKMNGYDGGANTNEDWLITNAINCDNFENIMLSFDHARNYGYNSQLYVLVSNDYDGTSDPTSNGTWNDITSQFTFPDPGGWTFIDAGTVDISAYVGSSTYVAYKYTSDDSDASTWEVDNILVEGDISIDAFIAGSFNGWSGSDPDYQMSINTNGVFELTHNLPSGTNEYKVVEDGNWYPNNNQQIILTAAADTTWKYNYDANLVMHTLPVVAGNFLSTMGGSDWDPTELMGEMEDPEGDYIYTLVLTIPVAGNYECKVTLNQNWDQSTGGNTPFISDGINPTTFTYDFPNNITTVTGPPPLMATVTFSVVDTAGMNYDGFYLKGSWDASGFYDPGWGGGAEHTMFYDDGTNGDLVAGDHIWMCEQQLAADGGSNTWEWGVNDTDHNWVAGNWTFTVVDDTPFDLEWVVPTEPTLVINEIMYNSIGADQEWVELFNNSGGEINLENWKLLDSDGSHPPIIIPAGYTIADSGYFTIAVEGDDPFPFTPDYDGRGNFQLNNGGDDVRLYNADGILVNIVTYTDSDPWPTEPDGDGPSLSLIDASNDNGDPLNWAPSPEDGGTPGSENFPPVPFVDITFPDGGEYLELGTTYSITWIYGFWDGQAQIELVQDGEDPQLITSSIPISDNSYSWTVWQELEIADDYKIRITGLSEDDPMGESDDFFSIIEPYIIPDIVITEIMYNPPESGEDSLEFLELYNNTIETVNLEGYFMSLGVEYTFPSIDIMPDTFLLLAKDSVAMMSVFGVSSYQWTGGALSNGGEPVELSDPFGNIVDFVPYDDQMPWDSLADGYGPSLTLCNPDTDNALPENWTSSVNFAAVNADMDSIYATPGFVCQIALLAGFSGDPTTIAVGDSAMFTDQTTGDPTSWMWTFEGGTPETYDGEFPPYITYNDVGEWDVALVVTDGNLTDSITLENYINCGIAPVADFVADETIVLAGSYINFTSMATGDDLTYQWTFEGGTPETSEDENPTEIYYLIMDWATYDVTLIVTNEFGSDTLTKEDYIEVVPESIGERSLNDKNVNLYPNPNDGHFTLSIPATAKAEVTVVDIRGQLIYSEIIEGSNQLDIQGLDRGVYLVRILDVEGGTIVVKRLIIH